MSASGNAALIPLFISSPLAKSFHCAGDQAEDRIICLRFLSQLRHIFRLRRPLLRHRGRCCFCIRAGGGGGGRLFRVPRLLEQNLTHDGFNGGPVLLTVVDHPQSGYRRKRLHWRYTVLSRGQAVFPAVRPLPNGSGR